MTLAIQLVGGPTAILDVAEILGARVVVPLHCEGWSHFTQGPEILTAAFAGNGCATGSSWPPSTG